MLSLLLEALAFYGQYLLGLFLCCIVLELFWAVIGGIGKSSGSSSSSYQASRTIRNVYDIRDETQRAHQHLSDSYRQKAEDVARRK